MSKTPLTVGTLVQRLQEVATRSHLGLETVVVLCEDYREYQEFVEVDLDQDEDPENGAVITLKLLHPRIVKFDELTDEAKEKARDWYRRGALDYDWWDNVYEMAVEAGKMLGIEIDKRERGTGPSIFFNEHGASFDGTYRYVKGGLEKLRKEWPAASKDGTAVFECNAGMHEVAEELVEAQRKNRYALGATVSSHRDSNIQVEVWQHGRAPSPEAEADLKDALKSFAHWIHRTLMSERDYLMADEQVDESIRANEYTFTLDGKREG